MKLRVKSSARRWKFIVSWVRACSSRLTKNASLENWPYASSTSKGRSPLPIVYKDVKLECGYRIDLLVESRIIVELKSIEAFAPIHEAIILTYIRLSGCRLGLLINFNVTVLKDGIKRYII